MDASIAEPAPPQPSSLCATRNRLSVRFDTARSTGLRQAQNTPVAGSPRALCTDAPQLPASRRALPLSRGDMLHHGVVQHLLGQQLLQLRVLVLKSPQSSGIRHFKAAELRLPFIERRRADPMLAAYISRRNTALLLLQDRDDLLFAEP